MHKIFISIAILLSLSTGAMANSIYAHVDKKVIGKKATIIIKNRNAQKIGTALLTQGATGVLIEIQAKNLPAGKHGMHFHTKAICDGSKKFKTAKGHIAVYRKPSGYLNKNGGPHEGNLPNLIVSKNGTVHTELYSEMISFYGTDKQPALFDKDGSSLVIHTNKDDHKTQPIGGAGARIACGIIKK